MSGDASPVNPPSSPTEDTASPSEDGVGPIEDAVNPIEDAISPIEIVVLGKNYHIACKESEHESLLESAYYLDREMREIRDTGRVIGQDRIAVMAALNIAHELAQTNKQISRPSDDFRKRLIALQEKIDGVLDDSDAQ